MSRSMMLIHFSAPHYDALEARKKNRLGIRLREARTLHSLQQTQVVERLRSYGVSISSGALSKWEKGDAMPSPYQLFALCDLYGIDDLLGFFDVRSYRLNETGRRKILEYTHDLIATGLYCEKNEDEEEPGDSKTGSDPKPLRTVPVSYLKVSAGHGMLLDEENFEIQSFPEDMVPDRTYFGLYISGDSMEPAFTDHELIWVQRCSNLHPGEIGIFILDGEGYIKKYTEKTPEDTDPEQGACVQPVLISLNQAYAPIPVSFNQDFRIVGRVLNSPKE